MDIGKKLIELRKSHGYTRKEFAEKIGIPYATLRNYESNVREPGHVFLVRVADEFDVSVDYILGNAVNQKNASDLSDIETNLIYRFRKLDEHGRYMINITMDGELKRIEENATKNITKYTIPYYDIPVSAGTGEPLDYSNCTLLELSQEPPRNADFVVRVSGDSMEPNIHDGDKLFVSKSQPVEYGDIGLFYIDGNVYVKEYTKKGLKSYNEKYPLIEGRQDISTIGKIVGFVVQ